MELLGSRKRAPWIRISFFLCEIKRDNWRKMFRWLCRKEEEDGIEGIVEWKRNTRGLKEMRRILFPL